MAGTKVAAAEVVAVLKAEPTASACGLDGYKVWGPGLGKDGVGVLCDGKHVGR